MISSTSGISGARDVSTATPAASAHSAAVPVESAGADSAAFSAEGVSAARSLVGSERYDDIRLARVEEAKRNIEEGLYRIQEVIFLVAQRVSRFVR